MDFVSEVHEFCAVCFYQVFSIQFFFHCFAHLILYSEKKLQMGATNWPLDHSVLYMPSSPLLALESHNHLNPSQMEAFLTICVDLSEKVLLNLTIFHNFNMVLLYRSEHTSISPLISVVPLNVLCKNKLCNKQKSKLGNMNPAQG